MDNEIQNQSQNENLTANNANNKIKENPVIEYISKSLLGSIKIIGYFGVVLVIVALAAGIMLGWPKNEVIITSLVVSLGILLVVISESLLRRKIWGWYLGMIFFGIALISVIFIPHNFKIFVFFISLIILIGLFIYKKIILEKDINIT
jgi:general stress protein CsbA